MISIKNALMRAIDLLSMHYEEARIDAEILLCSVLDKNRAFLYSHSEMELNDIQDKTYQSFIAKRASGIPIAYILGQRDFWSLSLDVNDATLIPRPETELLVELTLKFLKHETHATILDLGTGSGAIALAIASERPQWKILAGDKNPTSIQVAENNAKRLKLNNIQFFCSDWFSTIPQQTFQAIVANPPYIAENDPHLTKGDLRFEPRQALASGHQGLDALNYLIEQSFEWLAPGGFLLLEHGYDQREAVLTLLTQRGYADVQCWKDYQGHDRVSGGWRK